MGQIARGREGTIDGEGESSGERDKKMNGQGSKMPAMIVAARKTLSEGGQQQANRYR